MVGHRVVALGLSDMRRSSRAFLSSTAMHTHNASAMGDHDGDENNKSVQTDTRQSQIMHNSKAHVCLSSRHHVSAFSKANMCVRLSSKIVWKCSVQNETAASAPFCTFVSRQFANNTCTAHVQSSHQGGDAKVL